MARSTEERFLQIAEKIEQTDKERGKLIKKKLEEVRKRFESINGKLWSLETRIDTINSDQAESSCAI